MVVRFTPEALAQLATRRAWWLEHRAAASTVFDDELDASLKDIVERGSALPVAVQRGEHAFRRVLMPRAGCHLYFEITDDGGDAVVVSAWGARMRRLPPLAKGRG